MVGEFLFQIGNFGIPSMGLCILVGAILAVFISWLLRKYSALDWNDEVVDAIILAVLLGFVGMKILYWIVDPGVFKTAFENGILQGIWNLLRSGMVFYGGLIGGILGIFLVSLKKKKNFFEFTDLMAPCFCVAHAFGRIGCLLVGCCYGIRTGETSQFGLCTYNGFCAVPYPPAIKGGEAIMRLPVPLMEAIFLLILCGVLVLIYRKEKRLGGSTGWYLILYAVWRFIIEIFRGDGEERGGFGGLFTSQWISILILIAGVAVLILARRWEKGKPFVVFREEDMTVPEKPANAPEQEAEAPAEESAEEAVEEAEKAVEETAEPAEEPAADDSGDSPDGDGE